jgi:N-acetyl sugar amidotransferase
MRVYNEKELKDSSAANFGRQYQQCSLSVMDTIQDPDISFDQNGVSNYYYDYKKAEQAWVFHGQRAQAQLQNIIGQIKTSGLNKKYDCIAGISGGVDSAYLALQAKKAGLRPLIVHFDNGWNSEIAVKNIENIISKLGFDLYTLVVDWSEFRDLQLSYLRASVVDIEALTDHAILGTIYRLANQYGIKHILSGSNIVTEHVLPRYWIFNKADHINIESIHYRFGKVELKSYPFFNGKIKHYYEKVKGIHTVSLLNYLPYEKERIKKVIMDELDWKDYGGKHYESIFTRFYQGYILPVKFGIDKRKAHLSNLIFSGQISKETALAVLKEPIYEPNQLRTDYEFVLKKLGLSEQEFEEIMKQPRREHIEFDYEKKFFDKYPYLRRFRPIWHKLKRK